MKPKSATTRVLSLLALPAFLFSGLAGATENPAASRQDEPSFSLWGIGEPAESVAVGDHVRIKLVRSIELSPRYGEAGGRMTVLMEEIEGEVRDINPQSLVLWNKELSDWIIPISKENVRSVEIRRGHKSHALTGALAGLLVGIGLAATWEQPSCNSFMCGADLTPLIYVLCGPLVGLCVGELLSTEQWEEVEFGGQGPAAGTSGGLSLGWSVAF